VRSKAKKILSETRHKFLSYQFRKHQNWVTRFTINGQIYGGSYDASKDRRLAQFEQAFPIRSRILEMGSLEGGHSFNLARMSNVDNVVALEGRDSNIRKAELVRRQLGIENVKFLQADLESADLTKYGQFDVCFNVGLLYHLPQPWIHLRNVRNVTQNLFLWTHYVAPSKVTEQRNGYPGWSYKEFGLEDPLSGLSETSFWPSFDGLKTMLSDAGFPAIQIIEEDSGNESGSAVTLAAMAS
jgi:hypothetical protein